MGMYHSILLRPTDSQIIPNSTNILRLLEWLVENDEIIKPAIKPIQVELWSIPINNKAFDIEDLQEFSAISPELEAAISTNMEWTMPLAVTGNGPIAKCFELNMEQIANLAELEDEDDENESMEGSLLDSIRVSQLNLNYHKTLT